MLSASGRRQGVAFVRPGHCEVDENDLVRHPHTPMALTDELKQTVTFLLAGGQGERLMPLTKSRAKPAVPFGGAYRIIDFTLSNCIHSGLRRIYVLTQYQARSLEEHIRFGWNFLPRRLEQFISVRPPHHGIDAKWYLGTADAIYRNLDTLEHDRPRHTLILSGDHIYKMDYGRMLRQHVRTGAKLTIGAVEIDAAESRRFGIFQVDGDHRVKAFEEKPAVGAQIPDKPGRCLASMGIYIFETGELIRRLRENAAIGSGHDFGHDVIPRMIHEAPVFAHPYEEFGRTDGGDYWRDVGTIESYYEANLDLCTPTPAFNLYQKDWQTYTLWHNEPPAKTVAARGRVCEVVDSMLCPGTIVSGATVKNSILSNRVHVQEGSEIEGSILFAGVLVGQGVKLRRCIVDKWTVIPAGVHIGYDEAEDSSRYPRSDSGIIVIPSGYEF